MKILDPCCGSRMMYFDKQDQRVLFGDIRQEEHFLKDREKMRYLEVKPDIKMDFTNIPFPENSFRLVVFADDGIDILWCRCDETISYNDFGEWLSDRKYPVSHWMHLPEQPEPPELPTA